MSKEQVDEDGYPNMVEVCFLRHDVRRTVQKKQATWDSAGALLKQHPGSHSIRFNVCWRHVCSALKGQYERKMLDKLLETRFDQIVEESEAEIAEEERKKREELAEEERKKREELAEEERKKKRPPPPPPPPPQDHVDEPANKKQAIAIACGVCPVCSAAQVNHMIVPCKHVCLCESCARRSPEWKTCPMCRGDVAGIQRVFVV